MVVIMQHDSESGQIIICILKNRHETRWPLQQGPIFDHHAKVSTQVRPVQKEGFIPECLPRAIPQIACFKNAAE